MLPLEPLPYHVAVAAHLERLEPQLWAWFGSDDFAEKYKVATGEDLLRTAIRLDRKGPNERRYALAEQARDALGLGAPIVLHQMQDAGGAPNAFLVFTPGEIVIAFAGRILELLDAEAELLDLLGHEISHYKLFVEAGGRYHTADRLLAWMLGRDNCPPEFVETWRRNRLYTEIYCDLGGLIACGDRDTTIRGLVKTIADFKDADAESYLRQAEELLARGPGASRGLTHPELHVRVLAIRDALAKPAPEFHAGLDQLIAGNIELGGLDIPDQQRLLSLTRQVVDRLLAMPALASEAALAHARQMFPDYKAPEAAPAPLRGETTRLAASGHDYLAYVLLDFATVDDGSAATLSAAAEVAGELGLGPRFREIARQELRGRRIVLQGLKAAAD